MGLSRTQIDAFHWKTGVRTQIGLEQERTRQHLRKVSKLRERIRSAGEDTPDWELRRTWDDARYESGQVALLGDLALAAFVEGKTNREREEHRKRLAGEVMLNKAGHYRGWLEGLRRTEPPLAPFHWEIEFPEVFERENPGFDAIVGNPPFAGKNTVRAANINGYPEWLKTMHAESHGNSDLVAHFFRRSFNLLRDGGTFGLIATNTIAQGDTRSTGLRWICEHGGEIYRANRRYKWPGQAAVVVSVVHVHRGKWDGHRLLDDERASDITAFLFHRGGHRDPARLMANARKSFVGSYVLGMGFTFDDTDKKGVATPLTEMRRLIEENPHNQDAIFPYIGGEEVNASPTHAHHRYVINFRDFPLRRGELEESWKEAPDQRRRELRRQAVVPIDYPEPVAADWPDLLAIVEERVKPERDVQNRKALRERWWHYAEKRPGLNRAIADLKHVLVVSRVGQQGAIASMSADMVHGESLIVFPRATSAAFCAIQSRPHEIWARFFGSSMKDDLRYTPSDCFETFPFPCGWQTHPTMKAAGKEYYDFRAVIMVKNKEGLTKTYNRFHDPNENDAEIEQLRDLHATMDRAVLDAYGWQDIATDCDFLLDYPIDEAEWGNREEALSLPMAGRCSRRSPGPPAGTQRRTRRPRARRPTVRRHFVKRAEIVIPGDPGIVLARVAPLFSSWFGENGCILGGGTVLASRWQHRVSTDIDLFTDHERYQERIASRREEVASELEALVAQAGEGAVEVERGWLRVHLPEGPAALMTIPRPSVRDAYTEVARGTEIPTESSAEILARKLQSRILDLGVFTDRDLYDLLVAQQHDPEALRRVLNSITTAERATIANELRTLPHHWSSGEPVREPAYPDLLSDLAGRARRLFEADLDTIGQDRGTSP